MYHVYILRSDKDGKLYTGFTTNIRQRVADHNRGHVPSTVHRRPLKLVFFESYANKDDAVRREVYLKTSAGKKAVKFMLRTTLAEKSSGTVHSPNPGAKMGVDIVVLNVDNHVLLIRRSDDGSWSMPGGWVEAHETPDTAIRRELREETELSVDAMTCEDIIVRDSGSIHITYSAKKVSGKARGSSEGTDVQYLPVEKVSPWHADHESRVRRVMATADR